MAKYRSAGNTVVKVTDSGGTLRDLSSYVDTVTGLGKEVDALDVTSFADTAEKIIAGIEKSQEWTLSGHFDDTATTGPDAVLAPLVGTAGSLEFYPIGTTSGRRKISGSFLCTRYTVSGEVKGRIEYECLFKLNGTITVGTA